jgi:hypothetical protein
MYTGMRLDGRWYGYRKATGGLTLSNVVTEPDTAHLVIIDGKVNRGFTTQPAEYYQHRGITCRQAYSVFGG